MTNETERDWDEPRDRVVVDKNGNIIDEESATEGGIILRGEDAEKARKGEYSPNVGLPVNDGNSSAYSPAANSPTAVAKGEAPGEDAEPPSAKARTSTADKSRTSASKSGGDEGGSN